MSHFVHDRPPPRPNGGRPVWEMVVEDMRERDRVGRQRYGVPLQAGNGRDALVDAYQEALDLCVYLRQAIEEREAHKKITSGLADRVAAQSELLSKRAERPPLAGLAGDFEAK